MKKRLEALKGVIVPVVTPVDSRDRVDQRAFRRQISRLIGARVHALFVGGSAGEGPLLSDTEWRRMLEIALDEVKGRVPLLGGVMETSSRRTRERVRILREIGYQRFVLTPSFYITTRTATEHLRLFGEAREAAGDMEMIAYNIPSCTYSDLAIETLCDMAKRGWIRSCKESSSDFDRLMDLLPRAQDVGLGVLSGDERFMDTALVMGAKGIIPVCANFDPAALVGLYEAAVSGDSSGLVRNKTRLLAIRKRLLLSGPSWIAGIKYGVGRLGFGSGRPVSPLEPATASQKAAIDELVQNDRKRTDG